jgi:hypothetical protein
MSSLRYRETTATSSKTTTNDKEMQEQTSSEMATEEGTPRNVMTELLTKVREYYRNEKGEDPPGEFMEEARRKIVLEVGRQDQADHREIYEKLAEE